VEEKAKFSRPIVSFSDGGSVRARIWVDRRFRGRGRGLGVWSEEREDDERVKRGAFRFASWYGFEVDVDGDGVRGWVLVNAEGDVDEDPGIIAIAVDVDVELDECTPQALANSSSPNRSHRTK
jgi:hypothetical protein